MNQVIIRRRARYEVSWKTPFGVFYYGFRDNVKEAFGLARWISRYYLRYDDKVEYLCYSVKKKFTEPPEIITDW